MSDKKSILEEAQELVHGDRQKSYGHPYIDFSRTAKMLTGLLSKKLRDGEQIEPEEVALIQVCVKLSRLEATPGHHDSMVDIAGYAAVYEMVVNKKKELEEIARGIWPDGGNLPGWAEPCGTEKEQAETHTANFYNQFADHMTKELYHQRLGKMIP